MKKIHVKVLFLLITQFSQKRKVSSIIFHLSLNVFPNSKSMIRFVEDEDSVSRRSFLQVRMGKVNNFS